MQGVVSTLDLTHFSVIKNLRKKGHDHSHWVGTVLEKLNPKQLKRVGKRVRIVIGADKQSTTKLDFSRRLQRITVQNTKPRFLAYRTCHSTSFSLFTIAFHLRRN